jgi:hypothetical protein
LGSDADRKWVGPAWLANTANGAAHSVRDGYFGPPAEQNKLI